MVRARFLLPFVLVLLLQPPAAASEASEVAAVRRLLRSEDPSERAAAVRRLAGATGRAAARLLVDALADPHPYVRRAAAGVIAASQALPADLRRVPSPIARAEACRVHALRGGAAGRAALLEALSDRAAGVRAAAVRWLSDPRVDLASGPEADAVPAAIAARLEDADGEVRALALDALRALPGARLPSPRLLDDPDPRVRLSALESFVAGASRPDGARPGAGGGGATVALRRGLDDAVWSVRLLAAELARAVPDRRVLAWLVEALEDERQRVAEAAHASLMALTGIPFDPDPAVWRAWLEEDGAAFDPARGPIAGEAPAPGGGERDASRTVARPRFLGLPLVSRHVGFVLDTSSSMRRRDPEGVSRWDRARRELGEAVGRLVERRGGSAAVRLNVYLFHDTVEAVFPMAVRPTKGRRAALAKALAAVRPGGKTALYDGIAAALADPDLDQVVVLSDGAPSAGLFFTKTDLLEEVRRRNRWRRARIDVIAVGADRTAARWRGALRRLAEGSGGVCVGR